MDIGLVWIGHVYPSLVGSLVLLEATDFASPRI